MAPLRQAKELLPRSCWRLAKEMAWVAQRVTVWVRQWGRPTYAGSSAYRVRGSHIGRTCLRLGIRRTSVCRGLLFRTRNRCGSHSRSSETPVLWLVARQILGQLGPGMTPCFTLRDLRWVERVAGDGTGHAVRHMLLVGQRLGSSARQAGCHIAGSRPWGNVCAGPHDRQSPSVTAFALFCCGELVPSRQMRGSLLVGDGATRNGETRL